MASVLWVLLGLLSQMILAQVLFSQGLVPTVCLSCRTKARDAACANGKEKSTTCKEATKALALVKKQWAKHAEAEANACQKLKCGAACTVSILTMIG